jgi:uncharacterized protein YjbI with pentapeptide repeats
MLDGPRVRKRVVATHRVVPTWVLWMALAIVFVSLVLWAGYTVWLEYSGFERKTAWQWLDLIGISSAIALVGWIVARKQRERDVALALEQAQNEALRAYLDQMSNLMVDHNLGKASSIDSEEHTAPSEDGRVEQRRNSVTGDARTILSKVWTKRAAPLLGLDDDTPDDAVREVAQARTTAILLGVDGRHKRRPLKLIYELGLIDKDQRILNLKNAGLDHADFSELSLCKADLRGVDLRASDLSGADLSGADLRGADLRGADLRRADLSNADLRGSNLLPYDERDPERLSEHRLKHIDLSNETLSPRKLTLRDSRIVIERRGHLWPTVTELTVTNLRGVLLTKARLDGARLGGADLFDADLSHANLSATYLGWANLNGTKLTQANLTDANLTDAEGVDTEQLEREVCSLKDATMPDGSKHK